MRRRQASSGAPQTASSSDVTPAASSGSLSLQTSETTSGLAVSSTNGTVGSSTPSSQPADLTTTSSMTTTSASQPTSSSQPSSSSPSTSSPTQTSSSSVLSHTTSSVAPSSSSVPPSSTTQPPKSSSSQQGTPTTITSAYTTFVNGTQILTSTTIPSTIPEQSSSSSSDRTAMIAGSAAGATALFIILLSLAFCVRRKRFKKLDFLYATMLKRKQEHSRATLLDGEDLDVDLRQPPRTYTDYDTPWDNSGRVLMVGREPPGMPIPTQTSRRSETGLVFKEEVWPVPNENTRLMDPLANRDDLDLTRIVDDVMGPSSSAVHFSDRSISSMYRDSVVEPEGAVHSRTVSNASNAALLEAAGLSGPPGIGLPPTAPVRPSPLAHTQSKPSSVEHQRGNAP